MKRFTVAKLVEDDDVQLKVSEDLEQGPEVMFRNFKKEVKNYYCHVYQEDSSGGVLIYIPSVDVEDIFRELETA